MWKAAFHECPLGFVSFPETRKETLFPSLLHQTNYLSLPLAPKTTIEGACACDVWFEVFFFFSSGFLVFLDLLTQPVK